MQVRTDSVVMPGLASARAMGASRGGLPDLAVYAVLLLVAGGLWWAAVHVPAALPPFAPWDFAPLQFATSWLALWWYFRGVARTPVALRPPLWRRVFFATGVMLVYAVLLTRLEYYEQHMFFLNRAQHIVMHHLGPLLIVLAWPGAMIMKAMPMPLRRMLGARALRRVMHILQQPVLAAVLFVGLIYLWLIPPVHFRAMIDPKLYAVMNWSMVVDGLMFWSMLLDPRPRPPARASFVIRGMIAITIIFPQILIGALVALSRQDLYGFYHWCGRIFPSIDALTDQTLGGLIIWIPGAMMSIIALMLVLNFARLAEDSAERQK